MKIEELANHFEFLDDLRASGVTNMWGAPRYLEQVQGLDQKTATTVFLLWQDSFGLDESEAIHRATKMLPQWDTVK